MRFLEIVCNIKMLLVASFCIAKENIFNIFKITNLSFEIWTSNFSEILREINQPLKWMKNVFEPCRKSRTNSQTLNLEKTMQGLWIINEMQRYFKNYISSSSWHNIECISHLLVVTRFFFLRTTAQTRENFASDLYVSITEFNGNLGCFKAWQIKVFTLNNYQQRRINWEKSHCSIQNLTHARTCQ